MKNLLLEKMAAGQKTVGTFLNMGNATAAECLGLSGLDYFVIDTEHGPFDSESSLDILRGAELRNITALARIKDGSRASILKMLDIGAGGLIIPNVRSTAEAAQIVEYGKYYPLGQRGVAFPRAAGFGAAGHALNLMDYLKTANEKTMLLPQCETKECLDNIEEIAAVAGISGIFIGPFDLSVALGRPAEFEHPEFLAALERIQKACKAARKYCFIFSADAAAAKRHLAQGFDSVAVSFDAIVFINAYKNLMAELRPHIR